MGTNQSSGRRVAVVAHFYPPHVGGLEVVAQRTAEGLAGRGYDVVVLTSAHPGPAGLVVQRGVRVRRVRAGNWFERFGVPFPIFGPSLLWHLWREVRRADVVQVHDMLYLCSWAAALACRLTRTPYVVTQHVGMVAHPSRMVTAVQWVVHRTVGALVMRGASRVLPINPVLDQGTRRSNPGIRTQVLRNGVEASGYRPALSESERACIRDRFELPQDELLVLYVGRFVPKKGFGLVASALPPDGGAPYRIVFVGGDRPAGVPEDPRRIYLGSLPSNEVAEVFRACDVFVCASVGEAPLTVTEAMASGLLVLANDDPVLRALDLGDEGVEYHDLATPDRAPALATRLAGLAADRDAVRLGGRAARHRLEQLPTWDDYLDELEPLLLPERG